MADALIGEQRFRPALRCNDRLKLVVHNRSDGHGRIHADIWGKACHGAISVQCLFNKILYNSSLGQSFNIEYKGFGERIERLAIGVYNPSA